jgi:hypothetical protein
MMDDKDQQYWRKVLAGGLRNTFKRLGWDPTKAILGVAFFGGCWALGLSVVSQTYAFLLGLAGVIPFIFIWGVIQAQAEMYRELEAKLQVPAPSAAIATSPSTNYLADPKPDFGMWRHRPKLTLLEAAQLWVGVRPSVSWGTRGAVNDTYAMLVGAIQSGELKFIPDTTSHPPARATMIRMQRENPHSHTEILRKSLKEFGEAWIRPRLLKRWPDEVSRGECARPG